MQAALEQAAQLLDRARSAGIPIIHIQHSDGPGSLYDVEGESGAIVASVAPRAGEPVVGPDSAPVPGAIMQSASLAAMSDLFAVVVPDAQAVPD